MKIIIVATGLELTPSLKTYVENKINKLSKLVSRFEDKGDIEVRVEIGRTTRHHHKGDVFRAEANAILPHTLLRAEYRADDLHAAIDEVKNILHNELNRYKERLTEHRRGRD